MEVVVVDNCDAQAAQESLRLQALHTILFHIAFLYCLKPYVKAVTHGEKLEWWIILMVDCVTILLPF